MDDVLTCPICNKKLRNLTSRSYLFPVRKWGNFIERSCVGELNHSIQFYTDTHTSTVDFLKVSLNPNFSRFLEIDFVNQCCRVILLRDNKPVYISIPKMIDLDFPNLVKLKERVALYVTFS